MKKIFKAIGLFVPRPIKDPATLLKRLLMLDIHARNIRRFKRLPSLIREHHNAITTDRDPWNMSAPDMSDFDQVLKHWGLREQDIPLAIRSMYIELIPVLALGAWGVYLLIYGYGYGFCYGVILTTFLSFFLILRGWRIQVLHRRRFTFFKDWMLWGALSWIGPETPIAKANRLKGCAK